MASSRIYPEKECLQCHATFQPHDARQEYCKPQCRIDYNNDKRKQADAPFIALKKRIRSNDKVLETAYNKMKELRQDMISEDMLAIAGYDFQIYLETNKNSRTGQFVFWNHKYGIEPAEDVRKLFFIRKK